VKRYGISQVFEVGVLSGLCGWRGEEIVVVVVNTVDNSEQ